MGSDCLCLFLEFYLRSLLRIFSSHYYYHVWLSLSESRENCRIYKNFSAGKLYSFFNESFYIIILLISIFILAVFVNTILNLFYLFALFLVDKVIISLIK